MYLTSHKDNMLYATLRGRIFYATNIAPNRCVCGRIALSNDILHFTFGNNVSHMKKLEAQDSKVSLNLEPHLPLY